jgi:hypothetical protein
MRIWINPQKLAGQGLAHRRGHCAARAERRGRSRQHRPRPSRRTQKYTYTVNALTQLSSPASVRQHHLRANPNGGFTRLGDVARVELGAQDYRSACDLTATKMSWAWAYSSIPTANALQVSNGVLSEMNAARKNFPQGLTTGRLQHDGFRCGVGQGSHHHAAALHRARRAGDLRLPAESALHVDSGGDDSGLADRNVLRDEDLRFHDQHDHALRPDAWPPVSSSTTPSS